MCIPGVYRRPAVCARWPSKLVFAYGMLCALEQTTLPVPVLCDSLWAAHAFSRLPLISNHCCCVQKWGTLNKWCHWLAVCWVSATGRALSGFWMPFVPDASWVGWLELEAPAPSQTASPSTTLSLVSGLELWRFLSLLCSVEEDSSGRLLPEMSQLWVDQ